MRTCAACAPIRGSQSDRQPQNQRSVHTHTHSRTFARMYRSGCKTRWLCGSRCSRQFIIRVTISDRSAVVGGFPRLNLLFDLYFQWRNVVLAIYFIYYSVSGARRMHVPNENRKHTAHRMQPNGMVFTQTHRHTSDRGKEQIFVRNLHLTDRNVSRWRTNETDSKTFNQMKWTIV